MSYDDFCASVWDELNEPEPPEGWEPKEREFDDEDCCY